MASLTSTNREAEKASSLTPYSISPVPSPDSQSPDDRDVKASRKRVLKSFAYHKVGRKRLRQCKACGSLKLMQKDEKDEDEVSTSTSPDMDDVSGDGRVSALDYMISKCLVQKEDVPFKPQNTNIRGVLNQGKNQVSILDIVELQIEKSFKTQSMTAVNIMNDDGLKISE